MKSKRNPAPWWLKAATFVGMVTAVGLLAATMAVE